MPFQKIVKLLQILNQIQIRKFYSWVKKEKILHQLILQGLHLVEDQQQEEHQQPEVLLQLEGHHNLEMLHLYNKQEVLLVPLDQEHQLLVEELLLQEEIQLNQFHKRKLLINQHLLTVRLLKHLQLKSHSILTQEVNQQIKMKTVEFKSQPIKLLLLLQNKVKMKQLNQSIR